MEQKVDDSTEALRKALLQIDALHSKIEGYQLSQQQSNGLLEAQKISLKKAELDNEALRIQIKAEKQQTNVMTI